MLGPSQPFIQGQVKIFNIQNTRNRSVMNKNIRAWGESKGGRRIYRFGLIYFKSTVGVRLFCEIGDFE